MIVTTDQDYGPHGLIETRVCHDDGTVEVTRDGKTTSVTSPDLAAAIEQVKRERVRDGNERTLHNRARNALATNATYLALASPTNAQTAAQVRALTRQVTALIRLTLDDIDDIAGT